LNGDSHVTSPAPEAGLWAVLKSVAETGALFAFFSFATGWSYLAAYFNAFGFRPMELDISASMASVFALTLIYRASAYLLITAAVAAALAFGMSTIRQRLRIPRGTGMLLSLSVLLLVLFGAGALMGRSTASEDVFADSSRLLSVGFYTDGMTNDGFPRCVTVPTVDCKLLIRAKGNYYFFKPILRNESDAQQNQVPFGLTLFALPESKVRLVQMQRGFE
jgi:hypothetical protein